MGFDPVDIPAFGGLVTNTDVEDASGAIDLSNVVVAKSGTRLEPRPGYTLNGTLDLSGSTGVCPIGSTQVLAGTAGTTLNLITASTGASVTSKTDYTTGTPWSIVPFGAAPTYADPTMTNPSFATNTTGWTAGTSTITRDTSTYDTTPASGRWDNTGASDALTASDTLSCTFTGTFVAGVAYLLTYRVRPSASPLSVSAVFGDQGASDVSGSDDPVAAVAGGTWASAALAWVPTANRTSVTVKFTFLSGTGYINFDDFNLYVNGQGGAAYAANGATLGVASTTALGRAYAVTKRVGETAWYNAAFTPPSPYAIAVQPKDNRLVAAGFSGATGGPDGAPTSGSHVYFSEPDAPLKWDLDNYVVLSPGDGETIRAACAWNDYLFVFKQSKFFVFYGNSTDSTGGSVFNYRTVRDCWPENTAAIYPGNVCIAPDGVYVITSSGVYRTTGGTPELATGALTNLFTAGTIAPTAKGTGGAFSHNGDLYFSVTYSGAQTWLVRHEGQWLLWDLADDPTVGCVLAGSVYLPSGLSTSGRKGLLKLGGTTDNGTAISGSYTSAYRPLGGTGAETHVRSSELHGTGTVTLAWGADEQTHDTADTIAMSGGIGYDRTGARGRTLSWKLAFSAAGWTLDRLIPIVQTIRTRK